VVLEGAGGGGGSVGVDRGSNEVGSEGIRVVL
jgi:hypothetical protein